MIINSAILVFFNHEFLSALIMMLVIFCYLDYASDLVVINEVCSSNFSVMRDEDNNYPDYIELYNPSFVPVSLSGFSLSDDENDLFRCSLQGDIILPRGYLLVYADGSTISAKQHAIFKISDSGENIFLSNSNGIIIDSVRVPAMDYNTSYARLNDGGTEWNRCISTPSTTNDDAQIVLKADLNEPAFSVDSGFYNTAFLLELTAGEGQIIYYTLDGSIPSQDSLQYTNPIKVEDASDNENVCSSRNDLSPQLSYVPDFKVDKATIIRAIAVDTETNQISPVVSSTYFVNYDAKPIFDEIPIMSIITDPDNLFDYEDGIYGNGKTFQDYKDNAGMENGEVKDNYTDVNGNIHYLYTASNAFRSGKESERIAQIEYFDDSHSNVLNQAVGIRISGQATRSRIQKSFNIFARDIYDGSNKLNYDFFGETNSSIKLRNGGSDNAKSKITDSFLQELAKNRAVDTQDSQPCIVFLNAYQQMIAFASENDLSEEQNYKEICSLIDVQSLIDFYCINLYIDNTDVAFDKNMNLWRCVKEEGKADTRWHWMLYDVDLSLLDYTRNSFRESESWKENFSLMDETLIKNLMKNEEFRQQFCITFMDIANSTFQYDRVHQQLMEWNSIYEAPVVQSHQRFIDKDFDEADYKSIIEGMDSFFYVSQFLYSG